MPDSSAPEPAERRLERGGGPSAAEAIEAEIADHLATSADCLAASGVAPDAAERLARDRFGDVRRVARRCLWIQTGDEIMFRAISIGLLTLLGIGLIFVAASGWHAQRTLSHRLGELSEQLVALHETATPPELTGMLYLGDRSRPAVDAEVMLCRWDAGERAAWSVVRRFRTDQQGGFQSGPLSAGDYCLRAPLLVSGKFRSTPYLQSQPIYVVDNVRLPPVEFDVLAPFGHINLRLSGELPSPREVRGDTWTVGLEWALIWNGASLPWRPNMGGVPSAWPLVGYPYTNLTTSEKQHLHLTETLGLRSAYDESFEEPYPFLAGDYRFECTLSVEANGGDVSRIRSWQRSGREALLTLYASSAVALNLDDAQTVTLVVHLPDDLDTSFANLAADLEELRTTDNDPSRISSRVQEFINQPITLTVE